MTLADPPGPVFEADSPLNRLDVGPELPGQDGSSGVVYPVTDDGRPLALKVVRGRAAADPAVQEQARADALAQAGIVHPRIAALVESGMGPDGLYLLMEWVEGRSLDAVLREGPMDPWAAATVVRDVAGALAAAAGAGVLHRDLTPAKVLVAPGGHAVLGDLGAGRRRAGDPPPAASLDYVAPEVIRDEAPTAATLEYALACIAFHALTGNPPFAQARLAVKTFWHVRAPRPLVSEKRPGLPQAVDAVLTRGLSVDPAERHGGAPALAAALSQALGTRPEAEAEPAPGARARRPRPVRSPSAARTEPEPAPVAARLDWLQDAGPGRLAWIGGAVAALALGAAALGGGLLTGRATQEPEPAATTGVIGTSTVAIVRPAGWRELDPGPSLPGVLPEDDVAMGPADGTDAAIVAGLARPGRDGLLPDALVDGLRRPPRDGEPVELGDLQGVRYAELVNRQGATMRLYAVPTTDGTALVACLGAAAGAAAPTCDQQAATLQLTDAEGTPVDPAPAYGRAVQQVFSTLQRTRDAALDAIARARYRAGQAAAAGRLAAAYDRAAEALREAPEQRFVVAENEAIVKQLGRTADAYRAMASAARRGDEPAYGSARASAIAAERAVERAVRRLEDAGYRIR